MYIHHEYAKLGSWRVQHVYPTAHDKQVLRTGMIHITTH